MTPRQPKGSSEVQSAERVPDHPADEPRDRGPRGDPDGPEPRLLVLADPDVDIDEGLLLLRSNPSHCILSTQCLSLAFPREEKKTYPRERILNAGGHMSDLSSDEFLTKCWKDLTEGNKSDLEKVMGKHNAYLAQEFARYCDNQRSVAAYVLQLYASEASTDRANSAEHDWRAAVAVALLSSASVFAFEGLIIVDVRSLTGLIAVLGTIGYFILACYVGFYHRLMARWAARSQKD